MPAFLDANLTTTGVIEAVYASGKAVQEWGRAVDGAPILSASIGEGKGPAILITAGVHASETAGVHAALNLLNLLESDHQVFILPLRDPFGFAGVNHCLSIAAKQPVRLENHLDTLEYLKQGSELLYSTQDISIFKLGDVGFIWSPLRQGRFYQIIDQVGQLSRTHPDLLQPLWGKSVMLLSPDVGCVGAEEMQRCWHGIFSKQGEWLHLNRFFGRSDPPPEVAAVNCLIESVRPGLICDLQEDRVKGFWLGIPRPRQASDKMFRMARAFMGALREQGAPILAYEEMLADKHPDTAIPGLLQPDARLAGLTWMDILKRGEGHNLLTYSATFTCSFGVEAPMRQPLAMRVDGITHGMLAAIREWDTPGN
jgi:hypothetical protein